MNHKIGFWSVLALVVGSQIGSGVFMIPAALAPFGALSLLGWVISGFGAIMLALVFAKLCEWVPKTGGPHNYVELAFGKNLAFFTGWTYWLVSWVSTPIVIITCASYLSPVLDLILPKHSLFLLELVLLYVLTLVNFTGIKNAGAAEFVLAILKIIPLILLPIVALAFFNKENFVSLETMAYEYIPKLGNVALLTLWGFIGLESATTPAGSVMNSSRTIPLAILTGTTCVAFIYFMNSLSILGAISWQELSSSNAPYVLLTKNLFGGEWHIVMSLIAAIVCLGTINAWILTSSQISLGLAYDGLLPKIFGNKNKHDAPYIGLLAIAIGISCILYLTKNEDIKTQIIFILDLSVIGFIYVYTICCLAFLKILLSKHKLNVIQMLYGMAALVFCIIILLLSDFAMLIYASLFTLSGIVVYLHQKRKGFVNL